MFFLFSLPLFCFFCPSFGLLPASKTITDQSLFFAYLFIPLLNCVSIYNRYFLKTLAIKNLLKSWLMDAKQPLLKIFYLICYSYLSIIYHDLLLKWNLIIGTEIKEKSLLSRFGVIFAITRRVGLVSSVFLKKIQLSICQPLFARVCLKEWIGLPNVLSTLLPILYQDFFG